MSGVEGETHGQENTDTTQEKGVKRAVEEVHSVNNWEGANLGDDERKQKFLRLMGASKKEHHGKFVIGDQAEKNKHTDASERAEEITSALEDQYLQGLEMKLTGASRRHVGLGFSEKEEEEAAKQKEGETQGTKDEEQGSEGGDSGAPSEENGSNDDKEDSTSDPKSEDKDSESKTESSKDEEAGSGDAPKKPAYMMGFVKSSS